MSSSSNLSTNVEAIVFKLVILTANALALYPIDSPSSSPDTMTYIFY